MGGGGGSEAGRVGRWGGGGAVRLGVWGGGGAPYEAHRAFCT